LLASAVKRYAACKFDRVVLFGSVVPRKFAWEPVILEEKRVSSVQNYVATRDLVVGIFPAVFELFPSTDLGSAGHNGFTDNSVKSNEICNS
jgi:hypothetical protein